MVQDAATLPPAVLTELDAAVLQAVIMLGLSALFAFLWHRTRRAYFGWFALAWGTYLLRVVAIGTFLLTQAWIWLYWHQVVTGWTALALLWGALLFSRPLRWRRRFLLLALFPPVWSYVAIYRLDNFLLAAMPAVLFLSLVTLGTGWVFLQHARHSHSAGAGLAAGALLLWGLHHLDYPFLRARGAWVPWGYYLDILFTLAVGAGILLLVLGERTADLERLQRRMLRQHEEERRRLSLHLHDETAQVFTAVKLQLGVLREKADAALAERLGTLVTLMDDGLRSIRNLTNDLRPSALDDLGLAPALRALADHCAERYGLAIAMHAPPVLPPLEADAELALYRALQEALANVAEHAEAHQAAVVAQVADGRVELVITDDGRGFPPSAQVDKLERMGHLGMAGMRERLTALGGGLAFGNRPEGGAWVRAYVPARAGDGAAAARGGAGSPAA
jgi:signal transduction histidine kinase